MLVFGAILMAIIAFLRKTLREEGEKPNRAVADTLLGASSSIGSNQEGGDDRRMTDYASEIGKNVYEVGKKVAKKAKEGLSNIHQYPSMITAGANNEPESSW